MYIIPIFLVQQRKRIHGIDTEFDPQVEWQHGDEYSSLDEDQEKLAQAFYDENDCEPYCIAGGVAYATEDVKPCLDEVDDYISDIRRIGYVDTWEFVQPFFTKAGAERYIEENGHNLNNPRIYVDSAYRNREWQAMRKYLVECATQAVSV